MKIRFKKTKNHTFKYKPKKKKKKNGTENAIEKKRKWGQ